MPINFKKHLLLFLLFIAFCWGCTHNPKIEKYQNKRDNVVLIREKVKEIKIEDVLIGSWALLYPMDKYLIISDYKAWDKFIHIFDKNGFDYLTSSASRGQGPGEITNIGHIGVDETNRMFYISDHGKQRIFSYELDSVLANPFYMPKEKMKMNVEKFPDRYLYVNDTLCIGLIIEPIGNSDFKPSVAKWNMNTGEIELMKYEHPKIEKKRICYAASIEHGVYIEAHQYYDLMTICTLDGELKSNIYGRKWTSRKTNQVSYYVTVAFCGDKIFALYSGEDTFSQDEKRGMVVNRPTKFLVFNIDGDYIQTLETGYRINNFCYDKENNRIIMNMDDDIQFAYLDLDGLVE